MVDINDFMVIDDLNIVCWFEGMVLVQVNNVVWVIEGIFGCWYQDICGVVIVIGIGGNYVLIVNWVIIVLYDGLDVIFWLNYVNFGVLILVVNGLVVVLIKIVGDVDIFVGLFKVGLVVCVVYDGINFQIVSVVSVVDIVVLNVFMVN